MVQMLSTRGLAREVVELLQPTGITSAHDFRVNRLRTILSAKVCSELHKTPFFERDAVIDTFIGTQFDNENHRRLSPYLQAALMADKAEFLKNIDNGQRKFDSRIIRDFDVVVIGSGPHGVAVVANLREKFPQLTTILIDQSEKLGGQFRSYGPKPAFMMNSRVRRANRRLKPIPRTAGNINPLGTYVPLELSDMPVGNYAMNTDFGDICAVNAFMSANVYLTSARVERITSNYSRSKFGKSVFVSYEGTICQFNTHKVVFAGGISQQSALRATTGELSTSETAYKSGRYFNTAGFYRHFGNHPIPLEAFADKTVAVIGAGDSALTCLEALIGNLPTSTYGNFNVGRYRPAKIKWIGAPSGFSAGVEKCLRNRYKNGIVQSISRGGPNDKSGIIELYPKVKVESIGLTRKGIDLTVRRGTLVKINADIVVDCTNKPIIGYITSSILDHVVGPIAKPPMSRATANAVKRLGVKENAVALWTTMEHTNKVSMEIGMKLTRR